MSAPAVAPSAGIDDEAAWAAVAGRDVSFDGRFVFGVATTGVYCRPGCASRRPRRENVRFFAVPAEAEAAGFRACRRCRPDDDARPSAARRSVEAARAFLDAHLDETVTLERLARAVHLSPHHLQRTFAREVGLSPRAYVQMRRAERLRERLRSGDSVSRAGFEAGYGSSSRVYEQADRALGMTPGAFRRGGRGTRVRFAIATSRLGRVLVAATERGVCAVSLGDDDDALVAGLRAEFPLAEIEAGGEEMREWVAAVVGFLDGSARELSVPLDVRASDFQALVWRALRDIPFGETRSYGEVAAAIGRPGAARAVARACASNPAALVIPCHRVVRGDGGVSGYRWGVERKRRLLEMERG